MTSRALLVVILLFGACAHAAQAQTDPSAEEATASVTAASSDSLWTREKLTGDWGGSRTKLTDLGLDMEFRLSQYYQGVTSGGIDTNGEYGGTMDYRLNLDANKLFGWEDWSLQMHVRTRFGEDVNADVGSFSLPNAGLMMPLPGDYHDTDLTGLVVSKFFPAFGGLANVTFGKLDVIDTLVGFFPNIAYGQEGFWNVNTLASNLPWFGAVRGLSLYGGIGVTINQDYGMPQSGFLFTGTANESTSWGSISDAFDEGVWLAAFHRFLWRMDDKPGYFMVFVGASTADQPSNNPLDFVDLPGQGVVSTDRKKPWDIALYVYQEFWQAEGDPNRKANFFIGGTLGPDNPQFAQWNFFANVEVFGLIKSRPHDRMGAAGWWNGLSDNFKQLVLPVIDLRDTYGFELYYNFAINNWLHLSADLQLIKNERAGDDLAVIPGVRLVIDF